MKTLNEREDYNRPCTVERWKVVSRDEEIETENLKGEPKGDKSKIVLSDE